MGKKEERLRQYDNEPKSSNSWRSIRAKKARKVNHEFTLRQIKGASVKKEWGGVKPSRSQVAEEEAFENMNHEEKKKCKRRGSIRRPRKKFRRRIPRRYCGSV